MKEEREDGGERREKARERERAEGMGRRDQTVFTHGDSRERLRCGGKRWMDGGTAN